MIWESATSQDQCEGDAWRNVFEAAVLAVAEKQGRDFLGPRGLLPLFERTRTMQGFDRVYASWRRSFVPYMARMRGQKLLVARTPLERQTELFFCLLACGKKEIAFSTFAKLIHSRAVSRDVKFFERIREEMAKRDRRQPQRRLAVSILHAWLYGFLWLLSSEDRLALIGQFGFKGKVTAKGIEIARRRLGLQGCADLGLDHYPQAPFKLDYSGNGGFRLIVPD
jgi:hypothetical protein